VWGAAVSVKKVGVVVVIVGRNQPIAGDDGQP
jgi:hypothetical protein